jgi:WD40 repeat protein
MLERRWWRNLLRALGAPMPAANSADAELRNTPVLGGATVARGDLLGGGEANVAVEWMVGDVILDIYEVKAVHAGGMGKVYRVRHRLWNIDLAVKTPNPTCLLIPDLREQFKRECESWIKLGTHPNIVKCFYVRTLGGVPRVFAQYCQDGSLADWIAKRRLYEGGAETALSRILDIAIQAAWGLQHAHDNGLLHRDIKPSNVILDAGTTARITDFGISVASNAADRLPPLLRGFLEGPAWMTPSYCSPEQQKGQALGTASDIWSWAVSVLEMFAGGVSWSFGSMADEALEAYRRAPTPRGIPAMPAEVVDLLANCFNREPGARPDSMSRVAADLQQIHSTVLSKPYLRECPVALREDAGALHNRALSLVDLGRYEEALDVWEAAVAQEPSHILSLVHRELVRWRTGLETDLELVAELERYAALYTGDWTAAYLLSLAEGERGRRKEALAALSKVEAQAKGDPVVHHTSRMLRSGEVRWAACRSGFSAHQRAVTALSASSDGNIAVSGSDDGGIKAWDLRTGSCLRTFDGHGAAVTGVCLLPGSRQALSAGFDGTLRCWDLKRSRSARMLEGHDGGITALTISSDGRRAFTAAEDDTVRSWDISSGRCIQVFREDPLYYASISNHSILGAICHGVNDSGAEILLTGSDDGKLRVWLVLTGQCVGVIDSPPSLSSGRTDPIKSICLAPDGRLCATAHADSIVRLWDLKTGQEIRLFKGHIRDVNCLSMSRDASFLISGGADATVRLWRVSTGQCVRTFEGHDSGVRSTALTPNSDVAITGGEDGTIRMWDLPDVTVPAKLPLLLSTVRLDFNARAVAVERLSAPHKPLKQDVGAAVRAKSWYFEQDESRHVRQVVILCPGEAVVPPRVDASVIRDCLGTRPSLEISSKSWAGMTLLLPRAGSSRRAPVIVSKANGAIGAIRGQDVTLAFGYYRLHAGGVFQVFVAVETASAIQTLGEPFVTENPHWLGSDDTVTLVAALLNGDDVEICFIADEPSGPSRGQFGIKVRIPRDCREVLLRYWEELNEHHRQIPTSVRDWGLTLSQFENENPIELHPILRQQNRTTQ